MIWEMWNVKLLGTFKTYNITMQATAEFASNSSTNIKLSKRPNFFSLDFEQVHYEK